MQKDYVRTVARTPAPVDYMDDTPKTCEVYVADVAKGKDSTSSISFRLPGLTSELWTTVDGLTAIRDALNVALVQVDA